MGYYSRFYLQMLMKCTKFTIKSYLKCCVTGEGTTGFDSTQLLFISLSLDGLIIFSLHFLVLILDL